MDIQPKSLEEIMKEWDAHLALIEEHSSEPVAFEKFYSSLKSYTLHLFNESRPEEDKPHLGSENQDEYIAYSNGYNQCLRDHQDNFEKLIDG